MGHQSQGTAEQFRAIAELQGGVAFIVDADTGKLVYASPYADKVLGYSAADLAAHLDGSAVEVALLPLSAGLTERVERLAAGDTSRERVVRHFDLRRRDGSVVPVEVISILTDGALVGMVSDISVQRERQAERKRFASMLNHEFRTPLSTIDGAIQRLEATASPELGEPTRERYRKIQGAVDRLIGMLDEYLSPDRAGGTNTRHAAHCEPVEVIREAAASARALGRTIRIDAGNLPAQVRCEPGALRMALQVLIDNAVRYAPAEKPISITGRTTRNGVEIEVADEGPGILGEEMTHLFDKAFRGRNAQGIAGSGMGLYLAKTVVEAHGGSLSVGNRAHCGAVFTISLPTRGDLHRS